MGPPNLKQDDKNTIIPMTEMARTPKPISQVMEALLLATGGNSDGIMFDPFEAEDEGPDENGGGTRAMEANRETTSMGQALAGPGGLPVVQRAQQTPLEARISDIENQISELQNRKAVCEGQLAQKANNNQGAFLQKKIRVLNEELAAKNQTLEALKQDRHESKVEIARNKYRRQKDLFHHTLFQNVKEGRLEYVKGMIGALDKEGVDIAGLIDNKTGYPLMHMALLEDKQDIIEFLLTHQRRTEMATTAVATQYCEKLTPLYIAIQKGKAENVKGLLDVLTSAKSEAYVNTTVDNKDYKNTFFNELPLATAVQSTTGGNDLQEIDAMFEVMIKKEAKLDLKTDEDGNTLLHLLVAQSCWSVEHLDYFRAFLMQTFTKTAGIWYNRKHRSLSEKDARVQGIKSLLAEKNKKGFTPLTLAAELESPLYSDLINWKDVMRYPDAKRSQQFSSFDTYDITNVTSLKSSKKSLRYNPNSVMHVLAHNNIDITQPVSGKDITTTEPIKSIINLKWQIYQYIFYMWFFLHLTYMSVFTGIIFHFGPKNVPPIKMDVNQTISAANSSSKSLASTGTVLESGYYGPVEEGNFWFILFAIFPLAYILFEIIDHCSVGISRIKCQCSIGDCLSSLVHLTGNGMYRLIGFLFSIFTLIWIVLHMMENVNQDIVLSIALLFGWFFSIMFTRTITFRSSQIGIFSIMAQRMLFYDLLPFLIISAFILLGFSSAIHATLLHSKETTTDGANFRNTLFDMLKYFSALDDGQDHTESREEEFAKAMLAVYGIISVVLLINMLIAAMNKTYEMVRATHRDLVMRQRLSVILMLERRLPCQCLREMSEKFEEHDRRRHIGVVSVKDPVPVSGNRKSSGFR